MKVKIEAIVDLGDNFVDMSNPDEVNWARFVVWDSPSIHLGDDVGDTVPVDVTDVGALYD